METIEDKKKKLEQLKLQRSLIQSELTGSKIPPTQVGQQSTPSTSTQQTIPQPQESQQSNAAVNINQIKEEILEQKRTRLSIQSFIGEIKIVSKERITIDQSIQCQIQEHPRQPHKSSQDITQHPESKAGIGEDDEVAPQHKVKIPDQHNQQEEEEPHAVLQETELNQTDIDQIVKSKEFQDFFNKTSKIVEKELISYTIMDNIDELISHDYEQVNTHNTELLTHVGKYTDPHYTENRIVTDIQWSKNLPEVFMSTYSEMENGTINDHLGLALVWSVNLKSRAEYYLFAQSKVGCAQFNPFQHNEIIGGLYNGQVVIWDMRAKNMPVMKFIQNGHTHPISSVQVIGTENAHSIVTASNDGKICTWSKQKPTEPVTNIDLRYENQDINITCLEFLPGDVNNFVVGTEEGKIYQRKLHCAEGEQNKFLVYQGHQSLITSISFSSCYDENSSLLNGLMLSSSYDWTTKLWTPKLAQTSRDSFEGDDNVYDSQWNPVNPTLFITGDGEGLLKLWDLTQDPEAPVFEIQNPQEAINKLSWSPNGHRVATGDILGSVNLYNLEKNKLKYDKNRLKYFEKLVSDYIQ